MPYSSDRRERARQLVAEGKLGGAQPGRAGGDAKARRASELAAGVVERHRARIERAIVAGLDSPRVSQRLQAAELALKLGLRAESQSACDERQTVEHLDRQELIDRLAVSLTSGPAAGLVSAEIARRNGGADVDADAVELPAD